MAWALSDVTTAVDLSAAVEAPSLVVTGRAYANISRLSARIRDEASAITIATEHEILLLDGATKVFAGYVRALRKTDTGVSGQRVYEIECQDYTTLLADDVIDTATGIRAAGESDAARIAAIFTAFGTRGVVIGASVQTIKASMPGPVDYIGKNLHEFLTMVCAVTGGSFYVDYDKVLHYFTSEANAAPFGLSDNPNGTTTFGYERFSEASDTVEYANAAFGMGDGVSNWRYLGGSPPAAGTRRAITLLDPEITDIGTLNARLDSLISTYGQIRKPSSLVTYKAGLRVGQYVQVTHAGWSISAVSYRIAGIVATPETKDRIAYLVDFGNAPADLASILSGQAGGIAAAQGAAQAVGDAAVSIADLSIGGANLVPNSSFEDGTSWIVGAQWAIGYTPGGGQLPFAGTDTARAALAAQTAGDLVTPKINVYRGDSYVVSFWHFVRSRTAGTFRAFVKEYDAANVLLATTNVDFTAVDTVWTRSLLRFGTAAGLGVIAWQTTTAKVEIGFNSAGASATLTVDVDGVQLERGNAITAYAPSPQELVAGSITTTLIADDAVTTPKLIAEAVTAGKIATGTITAVQIAAATITGDKIAAGTISIGNFADDPGGNLVPNSGFEQEGPVAGAAPKGWNILVGAPSDFSVFGSGTAHGSYIAQIIATNGQNSRMRTDAFSVEPSKRYRVGATVRGQATNTAAAAGDIQIVWYDQTGAQISALTVAAFTVGSSVTLVDKVGVVTAPATAVFGRVYLRTATTAATGDKVCFDDVFCYRADRDVDHASGNVVIDASGITIHNGFLTLDDEFGKTVAGASGFVGSWSDFIGLGLYNARFLAGNVGALALGRTADLPYWTLANAGSTSFTLLLSGGIGGVRASFSALGSGTVTSDMVPVYPGDIVELSWSYACARSAGAVFISPFIFWYKADGTASATVSTTLAGESNSASVGLTRGPSDAAIVPSDAAFARVQMQLGETGTHNVANTATLYSVSLVRKATAWAPAIRHTDIGTTSYSLGAAGTVSNLSPAGGIDKLSLLQLDATGAISLTGIVAPRFGKRVVQILNYSAQTITLKSGVTSAAANQFLLPGNVDFVIRPYGGCFIYYSDINSKWHVVAG